MALRCLLALAVCLALTGTYGFADVNDGGKALTLNPVFRALPDRPNPAGAQCRSSNEDNNVVSMRSHRQSLVPTWSVCGNAMRENANRWGDLEV
jgi:hypothetical protein